jgi:CheY-like chemotaxis protein
MTTAPFAPPPVDPPLVLLVDDNPDTLEMYSLGLQYEGLRVNRADNGERALEAVAVDRPDCIVTDVRMPRMTGMEFNRILRTDAATANIPVIALTAMSAPAELATARAAGFDTVLIKPCLPEHLAREVMRLVAASRALRVRAQQTGGRATQVLARAAKIHQHSRALKERHDARRSGRKKDG